MGPQFSSEVQQGQSDVSALGPQGCGTVLEPLALLIRAAACALT